MVFREKDADGTTRITGAVPTGLPGPQGPQGVQGDKGDKGDTGIQGVKGDTGSQGIQGVKGDTGSQGIQGVKGDTGSTGPAGGTMTMAQVMAAVYPVGSIYMSVNVTNPGILFGGTWAVWGEGKVPVGLITGDADFNTVEKVGGAKTHTLTTAQLASHNHAHRQWLFNGASASGVHYGMSFNTGGTWNDTTSASTTETGYGNYPEGGGQPHNNLQPYIVTYMWKRTA